MNAERRARFLLATATAAALCWAAPLRALDRLPEQADLDHDYTAQVRPLLETYCLRCHGETKQKGGVRLDDLDHRVTEKNVPVWTDARNVLDVSAMPPEEADRQPTREERETLRRWIAASIQRFEADHLETQGNVLLRRINLRAYRNMVKTLTGVRPEVDDFQPDGTLQHFDTVGSAIYLTQDQFAQFFERAQQTIAEAMAARVDKPKAIDLVHNLKKGRQVKAKADATALEEFIKDYGDPASFVSIREPSKSGQSTGFVKDAITRLVEPAICATYDKKKIAEVEAAGIDWQHDEKCMQAVLERLRGALERYQKRIDTISEFQPLLMVGMGAGSLFEFAAKVQVDIPGSYRLSGIMRTFRADCPMPMKFMDDGRTIATFLVDAPPEAPREYEATAWLDRGEHTLAMVSTIPTAKNDGQEMWNYYLPYLGAHFTKPYRKPFGFATTWQDDPASFGGGELHGYAWGKAEGPFITVSEFRAQGPIASAKEPTALDEALSGITAATEPTREDVERRILGFMARAYVGGCDAETAKPYVDVVMAHVASAKEAASAKDSKKKDKDKENDDGSTKALAYGLAAVLSSPRFLYLEEVQRADATHRRPLTGRELARRLAYFLWSDLPDTELVAAADRGALADPKALAAQVHRLLADPRSAEFRSAFTDQWLRIDHLSSIVIPYELFPGYDPSLLESAERESVAFFSELLDHDLSVLNFIDSDFAVIDNRLAEHYGIPGVTGTEFRRVPLPPGSHRGGLLGQASVLIATSNGMTSSLVRRGAFVMEQLLGMPPGVPPPNVPALNKVESTGKDGQPLTQAERLASHRAIASCARCHDKIDPLGIGLESFDAIGAWNDQLRLLVTGRDGKQAWVAHEADLRGRLPDGEAYDGADALRACLKKQPQRFLRRLTENLMIYALGRDLQQSDGPAIDAICERTAKSGYGLATLIESVVLSDQFRDK